MKKASSWKFFMVAACLSIVPVSLPGQEIRQHPLNPVTAAGSLDMVLKEDLIIKSDKGKAEPNFNVVRDIAADDKGNIFVVDEDDSVIKVFDKNGKYVASIGRKGQGPGEFISLLKMAIYKDEIVVYGGFRISYFAPDGGFIRHQRAMLGRPVCFDSKGKVVAQQPGPPRGNEIMLSLMKFNPEDESRQKITEYPLKAPAPPDEKKDAFPPMMLHTVRADDSIVWAVRDKYELNVVGDDGKTILIIRKEHKPVELTEELKRRFLPYLGGSQDQYIFPKYLPPIRYLSADDKNRIFVCTYESEGPDTYFHDVFDSQGGYIQKFSIKGLPMFWENGYLYCRGEDENGLHQVIRYAIKAKG